MFLLSADRLRLLDAIAALVGTPSTSFRPRRLSLRHKSHSSSAPSLFLSLGSTTLAAKLDAEDWRSLVNAYLDEASRAVVGLGGHVLKKLGDGVMALFGYPQAQENDAERGVRAALAIQRALEALNARNAQRGAPVLSARIGLDSGPVVVDSSGQVFGEAPNIAARVQGLAEPGSVLVTATVQRQTAGLFVAEDRGPHDLKGAPAPVTLYRIVRASGGGRRGGARAPTPLVGREEELDLLRRRWERARSGEGQLALIVGEPGIGKSRLIEEFRARLGETPHTWVEWSSSQLLQNTPLHPFAEWGRQRFGAELPADERLADLEGTLKLVGPTPPFLRPNCIASTSAECCTSWACASAPTSWCANCARRSGPVRAAGAEPAGQGHRLRGQNLQPGTCRRCLTLVPSLGSTVTTIPSSRPAPWQSATRSGSHPEGGAAQRSTAPLRG